LERRRQDASIGLTFAYFAQHSRLVFGGMAVGGIAVALVWLQPQMREFALLWAIVFALLCSPFTLKTQSGRIWWTAYVCFVCSCVGCAFFGWHNLIGWLCAALAVVSSGITLCLRRTAREAQRTSPI
jgi:hypothetical protein